MNVKDIKEDKIEFLENQSQRNSIRVDGIPDNDKMVKYNYTEIKLKHLSGEKFNLGFKPESDSTQPTTLNRIKK